MKCHNCTNQDLEHLLHEVAGRKICDDCYDKWADGELELKEEFRVIIAGSRHMPFSHYPLIAEAASKLELMSQRKITEVVCGMAKGADTYGMKWAICEANLPVKKFPADWETHGKKAGPIRNGEMADYADACIAFLYSGSRGTANMIRQMQNRNKPVYIIYEGEVG